MEVQKAIYNILTNDATVSGLVSTRIYPIRLPQSATYPAVRCAVNTSIPNDTKTGASTVDQFRVAITSYATGYGACVELDQAIRDALDRVTPGTYNTIVVDGVKWLLTAGDYVDENDMYERTSEYYIRVK